MYTSHSRATSKFERGPSDQEIALDLFVTVYNLHLKRCPKPPKESLPSLGLRKPPTRHQRKAALKSRPPPQRKRRPRQPKPETRRRPTQKRHLRNPQPSQLPRNSLQNNPRKRQAVARRRPSQQNHLLRSQQNYRQRRVKTNLQQRLPITHPRRPRANPQLRLQNQSLLKKSANPYLRQQNQRLHRKSASLPSSLLSKMEQHQPHESHRSHRAPTLSLEGPPQLLQPRDDPPPCQGRALKQPRRSRYKMQVLIRHQRKRESNRI